MKEEEKEEFECRIVSLYIFSHFESFDIRQEDLSEHIKKDKQEIINALPENLRKRVACLVQGVMNFMQDIEYKHMNEICLASIEIGKQLERYENRNLL